MHKSCWMVFSLLCLSWGVFSQQYIIRYNLANEKIQYLKVRKQGDTLPVSIINVTHTNQVVLQLDNTPDSYNRRIRLFEKQEEQENIVIPGIGNALPKNASGGIIGYDAANVKPEQVMDLLLGKSDSKSDAKSIFDEKDNQAASAAKAKFAASFVQFTKAWESWRKAVMFESNCEMLWKDLAQLRYDISTPAQAIKQQAILKTRNVLPDLVAQPNGSIPYTPAATATLASGMNTIFTTLTQGFNNIQSLGVKDRALDSLYNEASERFNRASAFSNTTNNQSVDQLLPRIQQLYRQILNDRYQQQTTITLNNRTVMAHIDFVPRIDSVTAEAINLSPIDTPLTRYITIYKISAMRFRNTFGFSFVSFAEKRWQYYVANNATIAREAANQYAPVVSTFLHFYAPRDRGFRWGGTFGAGLPISGEDKQIHLMLGLSTFFGKNDPVCITAGVSGAEVSRLTMLKVGDVVNFTSIPDSYFKKFYRVGYFISLSFNASALSNK